jgi:hypothetical protein
MLLAGAVARVLFGTSLGLFFAHTVITQPQQNAGTQRANGENLEEVLVTGADS